MFVIVPLKIVELYQSNYLAITIGKMVNVFFYSGRYIPFSKTHVVPMLPLVLILNGTHETQKQKNSCNLVVTYTFISINFSFSFSIDGRKVDEGFLFIMFITVIRWPVRLRYFFMRTTILRSLLFSFSNCCGSHTMTKESD